jgi:hypothetical protein
MNMTKDSQENLDYATPANGRQPLVRRALYCVGLPLLAGGLIFGLGRGGDCILGAVAAALGALLIAFALPVER